jgi:ABC-type multidrug transport system ATPase subunit
MIAIQGSGLGKNFGKEWLFRNLSFQIHEGGRVVVLGPNGSGKSTLLQIVSGYMVPSEGSVSWSQNLALFPREKLFSTLSYSSPYLELFEELSPVELIEFQRVNKPFLNNLSATEILRIAELERYANRQVRFFSSGMKQRLKNALAILSDTSLLLLDEPCSNFDKDAVNWYKAVIEKFTAGKTIIVCSNHQSDEHFFCTQSIDVRHFR